VQAESCKWKYVAARRLALYAEESSDHGIEGVVFEPNRQLWPDLSVFTAFWRAKLRQLVVRLGVSSTEFPQLCFRRFLL